MMVLPSSRVHAMPPAVRDTAFGVAPRRNSTPSELIAARSRSPISRSKKGRSFGRGSTSVTLTCMAANMAASAQPMTPPPKTVMLAGSRSSRRWLPESSTSGSSKGMNGGW